MKWNYSLTSENIWASFDNGEVEADSYKEAEEKALEEIKYNLSKVNDVLASADITEGFNIEMDFTQIQINPVI